MNKRILQIASGLMILLFASSCQNLDKEMKNLWEEDEKGEVVGTYHYLDDRGIKLFLPEAFKKTSISEYQTILDTILDKESYRYEIKRINKLQDMEGGFHLFFDKYSNSTLSVNSVDFMPLSKDEAQQFLSIMRKSLEQGFEHKKFSIEKKSAKYNGNSKEHIFKGIYLVEDKKMKREFYSTTYIVTSNEKTVIFQITTPYKGNFDPFITKINM
ncbi:hypothetical protein POV27_05515 [Aureisphaera galaxeae]|uniref:hypothetical protein n=1 Tax=Aureisphaera galaxeae TaxID=1538023 RepID=UPI002350F805|nr:hypothetical protein [Aureisphaera galaxeae]MDC8003499.1 hypothetical protein [Aureisphaera galaxeae]